MKELSLFDLNQEMLEIFNQIIENDGEIEESEEEKLSKLSELLKVKTDSCTGFLKMLDEKIELFKRREKEFSEARKAIEKKKENYTKYLEACVLASPEKEFKGIYSSIKPKKKPIICTIFNENLIPLEFIKTKTETSIDVAGIKKKLSSGEEVEGARLEESSKPSLNIKYGV